MNLRRDTSLIPGAGEGLFTDDNIKNGDIVCQYIGIQCDKRELMEQYQREPGDFIVSIHPSVRDLDQDTVILGQDAEELEDCGVLVNDGAKPTDIGFKQLRKYINKSLSKANVEITYIDNALFYRATRNIKAGNELYAHYGAGYWLLAMGMSATDIPGHMKKLNV